MLSSRRKLLRGLLAGTSFFGIGSIFFSRRALAITYLENKLPQIPNEIQNQLLNQPQKENLLAEIAPCVGLPPYPSPSKMKCLSTNA